MRKAVALLIISLFLFSSLAIFGTGGARAAEPQAPKEITVLNVPFNSEEQVDNHLWHGYQYDFLSDHNVTIGYNNTEQAADLSIVGNVAKTNVLLSGFVSALEANISFYVKIDSPLPSDYDSVTLIFHSYDVNQHYSLMKISGKLIYRVSNFYFDSQGGQELKSFYDSLSFTEIPYLHVQISWNANRTYFYKISLDNGSLIHEGWMITKPYFNYHSQKSMWPPYILLEFAMSTDVPTNGSAHIYIKNLTETIPLHTTQSVFGYVPLKTYAATGFDGPYKSAVINGTSILKKYGCTATYFFAEEQQGYDWNKSVMKELLIDDGMEFGIHTNLVYSTYDEANITAQTNEIKTLVDEAKSIGWGNYSFVWTSLGNGYAPEYNDYYWNNWNIIGRKIWAHWDGGFGGISGNLSTTNASWNTWEPALRGQSWIAYAHEVEANPNPEHGADVKFFEDLIKTSVQNGIHVVGYFQYWTRYAAPEFVYGTLTKNGDADYTVTVNFNKFKVPNGFKAAIKSPGLNPSTLKIYDETTHSYVTDFRVYDWGVVFEAHDGHTYEIYEENNTGGAGTITNNTGGIWNFIDANLGMVAFLGAGVFVVLIILTASDRRR